MNENSLTEGLQEATLVIITTLFFVSAVKEKSQRQCAVLVGGFFCCMLIREMDFVFDYLHHGSWLWFALAVAALCGYYGLRRPALVVEQLYAFMKHPAYGMMAAGLLAVLVFSRIFGMHILWEDVMIDGYHRVVKNIVEEGCELFGYALCLISSLWYFVTPAAVVPGAQK